MEQNEISSPQREMPRYRCFKTVWALKIRAVEVWNGDSVLLHIEDAGYDSVTVSTEWFNKNQPVKGGYFVAYPDDGYTSFSPQEAFERGYVPMDNLTPDQVVRFADTAHEALYAMQRFAYQTREAGRMAERMDLGSAGYKGETPMGQAQSVDAQPKRVTKRST